MMKRLRRMNDQRKDKQRVWPEYPCRRCMSDHGHSVSATPTEQRVVVPPEVQQDTRNSIEDLEISQLEVKREVGKVQGVSLGKDKRESSKDWQETVLNNTSETSK